MINKNPVSLSYYTKNDANLIHIILCYYKLSRDHQNILRTLLRLGK